MQIDDLQLQLVGKNQFSSFSCYPDDEENNNNNNNNIIDCGDIPWDEMDHHHQQQTTTTTTALNNSLNSCVNQYNMSSSENQQQHEEVEEGDSSNYYNTIFSNLSGPEESRWRAHGVQRRKQLLEEDRIKGGRTFKLSYDTSVQRYFSIAHWALEQFHQLYQSGTDLEETYIMGYRIIAFLTEYLPKHPGFRTAPDIRQRARVELELLRECLEDVALQIDEETCNKFVDEFDPLEVVGVEDEEDDDTVTEDSTLEEDADVKLTALAAAATTSTEDARVKALPASLKTPTKKSSKSDSSRKTRMVRFEDWVDFPSEVPDDSFSSTERQAAESPTSETVCTSGTGSLEPLDTSYTKSIEDRNENFVAQLEVEIENGATSNNVDFPQYPYNVEGTVYDDEEDEHAAFPSPYRDYTRFHVRLDFLEKIANEEVLYETDSEAADSWAQTPEDSSFTLAPSSSGVTPTCDPARIAFRDLMNRLPRSKKGYGIQRAENVESDIYQQCEDEQHVENEIQRYLDDSAEFSDVTHFVESCHEKLKGKNNDSRYSKPSLNAPSKETPDVLLPSSSSSIASYSSSSSNHSSPTDRTPQKASSAFQRYNRNDKPKDRPNKKSREKLFDDFQDNFLEDDGWISFDDSTTRTPTNFFASSH